MNKEEIRHLFFDLGMNLAKGTREIPGKVIFDSTDIMRAQLSYSQLGALLAEWLEPQEVKK